MATHTSLASLFSDIADAIRAKTGGSGQIVADDFPDEINNISSGTVAAVSATVGSSTQLSLSFTVQGEPKAFACKGQADGYTLAGRDSAYRFVTVVMYDGSTKYALSTGRNSSGEQSSILTSSYFSFSYNNGTFTITSQSDSTGGFFGKSCTYWLIYIY